MKLPKLGQLPFFKKFIKPRQQPNTDGHLLLYSITTALVKNGEGAIQMSCNCNKHDGRRNCVCDAVQNINELQEEVEDSCPTSCFSNLLSPGATIGDTIPFLLFCEGDCDMPFKAFGDVGDDCFKTVFFRVESVKNDCCATLSLLRPFKNNTPISIKHSDDICRVTRLEKTDFCIEVDLNCFCAIQCLDPRLLNRVRASEKPRMDTESEEEKHDKKEREEGRGHR